MSFDQSKRLCVRSQLMYFNFRRLSCQAMFRVVSDWLHSLSVVLSRDMNTKKSPIKPEGTVFYFANQELFQHFGSFWEISIQQIVHIGSDRLSSSTVLLVAFSHTNHPHLRKSIPVMFAMPRLDQIRDILKCFNSLLCSSGLLRRAYELFLCFVRRSQ